MKLFKTIALIFAFTLLSNAQTHINKDWKNQINPIFKGLNKKKIPNEILLDYAMEFTNVPAYNGILTDTTFIDVNIMGNIYKTLFMGKGLSSNYHSVLFK